MGLYSRNVGASIPHSRSDASQHTNQLDHWELPVILLQEHEAREEYLENGWMEEHTLVIWTMCNQGMK